MAGKRNTCKVCNHKKVAQINKKLRSGDSLNSLERLYGISRSTLRKHKNECLATLLVEDKETKEALVGDKLIDEVRQQISLIRKLVMACDEYLTDPDDPNKYFLGPRGEEVDIVYQEITEEGRTIPQQRKATLQELLQVVESSDRYIVRGITHKHADPRTLLIQAITKLEGTAKMIMDASQKMIEWEHKKELLDKASNDGGTITMEKQLETISERVIVAFKESNTEELSKLAELPDLT